MKQLAILLAVAFVFTACKNNKANERAQEIVGTWRAVKMENPNVDSFFTNSQIYIDTVGKNNDAATNMQLYGVANMDSMRKVLQVQHDSAQAMQMNAVKNTVFNFRRDNVAVLSFSGAIDSSRWGFDSTGNLVLTELSPNGPAETITMEVVLLSDSVLKLRMKENNQFSTVTFLPERK